MRARTFAFSVALLCAVGSRTAAQDTTQTTASSALYIRNDSDGTTVVTPRIAVGAPITDQTRVDAVYTVDVWTSASVDIRTSASKPVTEQRDQLDLSFEHAATDLTYGGSYRYSTEYDYESHGGTLGGSYAFADNNATFALRAHGYFDQVGRAGDPAFKKAATTLGLRASLTQILTPDWLVQGVYEIGLQRGYLSSPYRYVRFSPDNNQSIGTCVPPVSMCAPEENPDSRFRHALGAHTRRALSDEIAFGAGYRFYFDDWSMLSHTVTLEGTWAPSERWLVAAEYRFYTQNNAGHYQPTYPVMPAPIYFTRDKELSALTSHRLSLEITRTWSIDDTGGVLNGVLLIAPAYFGYTNFPLLDHITAIEATLALEVRQ
jgi:hypothetical protein